MDRKNVLIMVVFILVVGQVAGGGPAAQAHSDARAARAAAAGAADAVQPANPWLGSSRSSPGENTLVPLRLTVGSSAGGKTISVN